MKLKRTLLALPLEKLLYKMCMPVQAFSLVHLLILPFYPIILRKIEITELTKRFMIFICYLLFISFTILYIDIVIFQNYDRIYPFIRQNLSLLVGIMFYFYIRKIFILYDELKVVRYILFTILIIFIFSIIDKLSGTPRVEATFTEPSHLGQYMAFIIIPLLYIYGYSFSRKIKIILWIVVILITILTLSFTTVIRIFLFIFFIFLFKKKKLLDFFLIALITLFLLYSIFILIPSLLGKNYMTTMVELTIKGLKGEVDLPLSFIDRMNFYYMINYIIANLHFNFYTLFGYGLGGDSVHYMEILPKTIYEKILTVKQFGYATNSFFGKVFIYSGVVGIFLFFYYIFYLFKKSKCLFSSSYKVRAILLAILIYSTIGLASFSMIELWFWLALVDAKLYKTQKANYER